MKKLLFLGIFAAFSVLGLHAEENLALVLVQKELAYQKFVDMYKKGQMTRESVDVIAHDLDIKDFRTLLVERRNRCKQGLWSLPVLFLIPVGGGAYGVWQWFFDYENALKKQLKDVKKYPAEMFKYCTKEDHAKSNMRIMFGASVAGLCVGIGGSFVLCRALCKEMSMIDSIMQQFDQFDKDAVAERFQLK